MAERLQRNLEELSGMSGEELKKESEELAKSIGSMPNASSDERVQNLTQFFEQMGFSEDPSNSKSMAAAAMSEALELVEQFFQAKCQTGFTEEKSRNLVCPQSLQETG